jgi:hypothetical protein
MLEISEVEVRWILEMKLASYGGVKDLRNICCSYGKQD